LCSFSAFFPSSTLIVISPFIFILILLHPSPFFFTVFSFSSFLLFFAFLFLITLSSFSPYVLIASFPSNSPTLLFPSFYFHTLIYFSISSPYLSVSSFIFSLSSPLSCTVVYSVSERTKKNVLIAVPFWHYAPHQ
jgi:hypothetical protein